MGDMVLVGGRVVGWVAWYELELWLGAQGSSSGRPSGSLSDWLRVK